MLAHIRTDHGPDAVVAFRLSEEALGFHVIQDHLPADLVRVPREFRADLSVDVPRVDEVEVRRLDVRLKDVLLSKLNVDPDLRRRVREVGYGLVTLDVVRDQPARGREDEGRWRHDGARSELRDVLNSGCKHAASLLAIRSRRTRHGCAAIRDAVQFKSPDPICITVLTVDAYHLTRSISLTARGLRCTTRWCRKWTRSRPGYFASRERFGSLNGCRL